MNKGFTFIEHECSKSSMNTKCSFRRAHHIRSSMRRNKGFTFIEHECSKNIRRNKGFTLIELLVITVIIVVMSALVIPNLRFGEEQFAVQNSAHKLAQDLRRVQEMAMSSLEFNEIIPQGGYGIYFEKDANFYTLFADCSGDRKYDLIGTPCNEVSEKISEQSFLNEKIIINNLFSDFDRDELNIVFVPPDPRVYIEPGNGSIAMIYITDPSGGVSEKIITVNKAGLIWIEDSE